MVLQACSYLFLDMSSSEYSIGNSVEAIKDELRKARGDEFNKLLRGDFGKAWEGHLLSLKLFFSLC